MVPDEIDGAAVRLAPMHNRIVEITGRFRADSHGHRRAYGGQIAVSRYAILGKHDLGDVPPVPPEPPVPWSVDAYMGFERAAEFDPPGSGEQWYWQNALQISGATVKLHKQTIACRNGKTWSTEGDGGTQSFEGTLTGSIREGNVAMRYIGCDGCLSSRQQEVQVLPIRQLSDNALRMGSVTYDRATKPYPDKCPVID